MGNNIVTVNQIGRGTDGTIFGHTWFTVTTSTGQQYSYNFTPGDILSGGVPSPWSEATVVTNDNTV